MLATVHSIVPVSVCLQSVNSFSISVMDEAALFKFGIWVEYGMVHPTGENEKFPMKRHGLGHVKILDPLRYFWNG